MPDVGRLLGLPALGLGLTVAPPPLAGRGWIAHGPLKMSTSELREPVSRFRGVVGRN